MPRKAGHRRRISRASLQSTPAVSAQPTPIQSTCATPLLSAQQSAYNSDIDEMYLVRRSAEPAIDHVVKSRALAALEQRRVPVTPFPFLSLPTELRLKVYEQFFLADLPETITAPGCNLAGEAYILDLSPDLRRRFYKRLALLRVCRQVHAEASDHFFRTFPVRIFPTHPLRYSKARRPLLARLSARQRASITQLELRVGPGWSAPPRSWAVTNKLGLADCVAARTVRVFVEFDPSEPPFDSFRNRSRPYERFCGDLLAAVLAELPSVERLVYDGVKSVRREGAMVRGLVAVAEACGKPIVWGSHSGWGDALTDDGESVALLGPGALPGGLATLGFNGQHAAVAGPAGSEADV